MRRYIIPALTAALVLAGCAKETSTDTASAAKTYFQSWLQVHYPDAERAGNGIYILEDTPGDGETADIDTNPYAFVDFTVTDLDGTVASTTVESVAKRVGSYSAANRYGERAWYVHEGYDGVFAGVEEMIRGMRIGGTRKAAIPYWLCTTDRYNSEEKYLKNVTSGSNAIYTITLHSLVPDIKEYEGKLLDQYAKEHLEGADSTHIAGDEELDRFGFYFVSRGIEREEDLTYTMPEDTTMYLNYTGKFLDGKVFDTTIENTAKDAGIFQSGKDYAPVKVTRGKLYTDVTMGGSSSIIAGFKAGIFMLHPMEKAVVAFYSKLGYDYSGSGSAIPPYAPLVFELELVEEPDLTE